MTNPIHHLFEVYVKINQLADEDASIQQEARDFLHNMEQGKNVI